MANPRPEARPQPASTVVGSDPLWKALHTADYRTSAAREASLEDALFRLYLPFAANLARQVPLCTSNPELAQQAAEIGLAQAVLAWRHDDADGFVGFATAAIRSQLRRAQRRTSAQSRVPLIRPIPATGPSSAQARTSVAAGRELPRI